MEETMKDPDENGYQTEMARRWLLEKLNEAVWKGRFEVYSDRYMPHRLEIKYYPEIPELTEKQAVVHYSISAHIAIERDESIIKYLLDSFADSLGALLMYGPEKARDRNVRW
jgi:putative lipase involved disintegration of autophagic bodies